MLCAVYPDSHFPPHNSHNLLHEGKQKWLPAIFTGWSEPAGPDGSQITRTGLHQLDQSSRGFKAQQNKILRFKALRIENSVFQQSQIWI